LELAWAEFEAAADILGLFYDEAQASHHISADPAKKAEKLLHLLRFVFVARSESKTYRRNLEGWASRCARGDRGNPLGAGLQIRHPGNVALAGFRRAGSEGPPIVAFARLKTNGNSEFLFHPIALPPRRRPLVPLWDRH
jgi:hypothetical protein